MIRRVAKRCRGEKFSRCYLAKRLVQLFEKFVQFDESNLALAAAIDLAINATEIAGLVDVQIDAYRNAAGTAAEHRIDVVVGGEGSRMVLEERGTRW